MKIVKTVFLEDCFDTKRRLEIHLSGTITEPFIKFLCSRGDIIYYKNFPKPLFKGDLFPGSPEEISVIGILDSPTFEAILPSKEEALEKLEELVLQSPVPPHKNKTEENEQNPDAGKE
jgi:hypothetical protein